LSVRADYCQQQMERLMVTLRNRVFELTDVKAGQIERTEKK